METALRFGLGLALIFGISMFAKDLVVERADLELDSSNTMVAAPSSSFQFATSLALLTTREVQVELALEDSQKRMIEESIASMHKEAVTLATVLDDACGGQLAWMPFEAWKKCQLAFQTRTLKNLDDQFHEILNVEQWSRLQQLQRQHEGIHAFRRPDVVARLHLTKEQLEKITELPVVGFFSFASDEDRSNLRQALARILTGSQWSKWLALRGDEFTFDEFVQVDKLTWFPNLATLSYLANE